MLTQFAFCILQFAFCVAPASAAGQALVRASVWVPPERMAEFEQVHRERVEPILDAIGFREARQQGRATVDSVFSRLYSFRSVKAYLDSRQKMGDLPEWDSLMVALGSEFGTAPNSNRLRGRLTVYKTPAALDSVVVGAKGKTRKSGEGEGHWRSYDVADGLSGPMVQVILESGDGHLWFGTRNNGVSRFDGDTWTQYRQADGLADDRIRTGLRDRHDRLWFGTMSGVCLYEEGVWKRFGTDGHPLAGLIWPILEDRDGDLWFGSFDGAIRWDGERATRYRKDGGLAGKTVRSAIQDRSGRYWFATRKGAVCLDPAVSSVSGADLWTTHDTDSGLPSDLVGGFLEDGEGRIWTATEAGLARYDGKAWERISAEDGLPVDGVSGGILDRRGRIWLGIRAGAAVYDGRRFRTFSTDDGLINNTVAAVHQDREGHMWFGTHGGVSQYDVGTWRTYRTRDGLPHDDIWSGLYDSRGNLWLAAGGRSGAAPGGLTRFDGARWTTYTTDDGLASNRIYSICETPLGQIWVGTNRGASRLLFADDGTVTVGSLGVRHGLLSKDVVGIAAGENGDVWLGCFGGGLMHYDGETLSGFGPADGLAGARPMQVYGDADGAVWYAGYGVGVSRLSGSRTETYTAADGLPHDEVILLYRDQSGQLWIGTHGGVCRFDGESFHVITTEDGLVSNDVHAIFQDRSGVLWFGTDGGGISLYDGQVFQTLTEEDGLASNVVMSILEDTDGAVWVATNRGMTRFRRPEATAPEVTVSAVVAGGRYTGPEATFTSSERLVGFEFGGTSKKTLPGSLVYRYRLAGLDAEWRTTRDRRVEYTSVPVGYYAFEVSAVDRDLVYSDSPARVQVNVTLPYTRLGLVGGMVVALIAFGVSASYAMRRRHERDRAQQDLIDTQAKLVEEMDRELQTAHEMQMGLLPKMPPAVEGYLLAGRCLPANHVGGDYYNFIELGEGGEKVAVVIADVSGHAMQAATVAMRFNEMLRYEMAGRGAPQDVLAGLDGTLRGQIPVEMFVTCGIGFLDTTDRSFSIASAGCPEVFHYRYSTESVRTLGLSGYPLGLPLNLRRASPYGTSRVTLEPGDVIVIASDGVEDAQNSLGAFYEGARLSALMKQLGGKRVRPETIRDEIVSDVRRFMGDIPQPDDITVVVVQATKEEV